MLKNRGAACLCLVWILAACQTRAPALTQLPAPTVDATSTEAATIQVLPSPTIFPTAAPSPEPSRKPGIRLCPPMQGIVWDDMPAMISNPFHPPPPGSDDPHQGVDFADLGADRIALQGRVVQAVLDGQIAAVAADRFPYGNALLVETPVELLPHSWLETLDLPAPTPTLAAVPALTCPAKVPLEYDTQKRSLYLLYAHLEEPPVLEPGQEVSCGQAVGTVGMSGNAMNPHLHLEVRVGPAGIRMDSMAHYDNTATDQEMANYCMWRVSGLFQLVDPMRLWSLASP